MKDNKITQTLTITIPKDLLKDVRELSNLRKQSVSSLVSGAVFEWVQNQRLVQKLIQDPKFQKELYKLKEAKKK